MPRLACASAVRFLASIALAVLAWVPLDAVDAPEITVRRNGEEIADATNTVCEGELLQLAKRENWALDEATYFEIIRRKTASLCGTCCRIGALLSDAPKLAD